jgi:hypothetical protein
MEFPFGSVPQRGRPVDRSVRAQLDVRAVSPQRKKSREFVSTVASSREVRIARRQRDDGCIRNSWRGLLLIEA